MNKQEFCDKAGINFNQISHEDWESIHTVYQFHPIIPDVGGKEKIAELFNIGGLGLIFSMVEDAEKAQFLDTEVQIVKTAIERRTEDVKKAENALEEAKNALANTKCKLVSKEYEAEVFARRFNNDPEIFKPALTAKLAVDSNS